jgi:predicted RNA-binding Zn-ribbon protein involved in translation (DUF1610 family)
MNTENALKHLNKKWGQKNCPMCGENSWNVSDKIFELREFHNGNLVVGKESTIFPVFPVSCNNCGNSIFVNALIAGAIQKPSEQNEK